MQIRPRLTPSLFVLLACACSFDGTGIDTDGQGASSTSGQATDVLTESTDPTAEPTTIDPTSDPTTTDGPTTMSSGVCGDEMVDPGEECDNGAANANTQSCKADCTNN